MLELSESRACIVPVRDGSGEASDYFRTPQREEELQLDSKRSQTKAKKTKYNSRGSSDNHSDDNVVDADVVPLNKRHARGALPCQKSLQIYCRLINKHLIHWPTPFRHIETPCRLVSRSQTLHILRNIGCIRCGCSSLTIRARYITYSELSAPRSLRLMSPAVNDRRFPLLHSTLLPSGRFFALGTVRWYG